MPTTTQLTDIELSGLNARFELEPAAKIIRWAVDEFGPRLLLSASFTDAVLIDLAVNVEPAIEVVFIDTGYHFTETLETVERVRRHYDLNLRVMKPEVMPEVPLYLSDPENCCSTMKVGLLEEALQGKEAWMSGIRRVEAPTRADAPIVHRDPRGLVKVNPIATWSDDDVDGFIRDRRIIVNPLVAQGFPSIGCAPCTKPVNGDQHQRAGRWAGMDKTECGLHT